MGIYMSIGAVIALILPFPVSLLAALGAFVLLNFIRTRRVLKKAGVDVKGLFRLLSSASMNGGQYTTIKYYCMSCGKEYKEIACPNCGSKMKRVG
jgi:asparagine N-glycosylation enzyme membrane subunit Stt3